MRHLVGKMWFHTLQWAAGCFTIQLQLNQLPSSPAVREFLGRETSIFQTPTNWCLSHSKTMPVETEDSCNWNSLCHKHLQRNDYEAFRTCDFTISLMHVILCPTVQQLGLVSDLKRRLQRSDMPPANLTGQSCKDFFRVIFPAWRTPQCSIAAVAPTRWMGWKDEKCAGASPLVTSCHFSTSITFPWNWGTQRWFPGKGRTICLLNKFLTPKRQSQSASWGVTF